MAYTIPAYLTGFLNDNPETGFQSRVNELSNRRKQSFYRGRFGDVYAGFEGQQGSMARRGGDPTTVTWENYLDTSPWLKEFGLQSPEARGLNPNRNAQRIRYSG